MMFNKFFIKNRLRDAVIKAGPKAVWLVPGEKRRNDLRKSIAALNAQVNISDNKKVVKAVKEALRARDQGRNTLSRSLLEDCLETEKANPNVLRELSLARLVDGEVNESIKLLKRALILAPHDIKNAHAYVEVRTKTSDDTPLNAALLKRFKANDELVWSYCKACETLSDLENIFDALSEEGALPSKFIRPFGNAALRVEEFDLGKILYMHGIEIAIEKLPTKPSAGKSIGSAGTEALIDIVKLLDKAGIPHFAAAGTCLGMVREGRPLRHDNDIDIGVMENDFDESQLRKIAEESPLFTTSQPHPKSPKIGLKHINGAEIDIFRFYKEAGLIWHNGVFVRWYNKPFDFEVRSLLGTDIRIPAGTEYLVENYGDKWHEPDPLFDAFLNGPNREVIWDEYYAAHMLRTINLIIRRGNFNKAVNLISDAIEGPYFSKLEKDTLRLAAESIEKKSKKLHESQDQ